MDNQNRNVVWQADYDEFGKATLLVEQVEFNHRLPGQYYDKETGLNYNYYRDYDSGWGRYLQSDPIGLIGGINTYGYVAGNPVSLVDPNGLDYWIEGSVKGEGGFGFHQSVCVGDYNSILGRKCISFGVNVDENQQPKCKDGKCEGIVYTDYYAAGDVVFGRYHRTSAEVDKKISDFFDVLLGRVEDYDLANNNCRDFSYRLFRALESKFGGL